MNRHATQAERDALEAMIDGANLVSILEAITDICDCRAEHNRVNLQNTKAAALWDRAADIVGRAACDMPDALNR